MPYSGVSVRNHGCHSRKPVAKVRKMRAIGRVRLYFFNQTGDGEEIIFEGFEQGGQAQSFGEASEELRREYVFLTLIYS